MILKLSFTSTYYDNGLQLPALHFGQSHNGPSQSLELHLQVNGALSWHVPYSVHP